MVSWGAPYPYDSVYRYWVVAARVCLQFLKKFWYISHAISTRQRRGEIILLEPCWWKLLLSDSHSSIRVGRGFLVIFNLMSLSFQTQDEYSHEKKGCSPFSSDLWQRAHLLGMMTPRFLKFSSVGSLSWIAYHMQTENFGTVGDDQTQWYQGVLGFLILISSHTPFFVYFILSWFHIIWSSALASIWMSCIIGHKVSISGQVGGGRFHDPSEMKWETCKLWDRPKTSLIRSPARSFILFPFTHGSYHRLKFLPLPTFNCMCCSSHALW